MTEQPETCDIDSGRQARVMSVADAARELNISERTIWRRIKAGKLHTIDMNGKTCVQVMAQDAVTAATPDPQTDVSMTGSTVTVLPGKLEQLYEDQIRHLKEENRWLREKVDALTHMLPAPGQDTIAAPGPQTPKQSSLFNKVLWVVASVVILVLAGTLIYLAFTRIQHKAQPIKQVPAKIRTLKTGTPETISSMAST